MEKKQDHQEDKQVTEDKKQTEDVSGLSINVTETIATKDKM